MSQAVFFTLLFAGNIAGTIYFWNETAGSFLYWVTLTNFAWSFILCLAGAICENWGTAKQITAPDQPTFKTIDLARSF